jgi:hypothetical protein
VLTQVHNRSTRLLWRVCCDTQVQDLPLHFMDSTLLLPVVVEHTIDERSPLYGGCSLAPQPLMPGAASFCPLAHVLTDALHWAQHLPGKLSARSASSCQPSVHGACSLAPSVPSQAHRLYGVWRMF